MTQQQQRFDVAHLEQRNQGEQQRHQQANRHSLYDGG